MAAKTLVLPWDYTNGGSYLPFPCAITTDAGTAPTAALGASGTGGTTGTVTIWFVEI